MPPGAPFRSFLLPYPFRIDEFTDNLKRNEDDSIPSIAKLHFLTHTHSDHLTGLQAKSFGQQIFCSQDAKMILNYMEQFKERSLLGRQLRAEPVRIYKHLDIPRIFDQSGECTNSHQARELLKPCVINLPFQFEYEDETKVTITAIDANHCPGSVMFLLEGREGNILHTGDFRAEPWFLESIKRNPFLQRYLACEGGSSEGNAVVRTLDAIYLDTACVMQTHEVPTKESATAGLISLMKLYPPTTLFFINAWTPGYEDILKEVARAFGCQIHLDRYKLKIATKLSNDPLYSALGTSDPSSTRFHACERFERCDVVNVDHGKEAKRTKDNRRVVYVNPVSSMTPERWEEYQTETKERLASLDDDDKDEEVSCLLVPLSRHSPLPELKSFVSLFRPRRVIPNTLDPKLRGLDWLGIEREFSDLLTPGDSVIPSAPPLDHKLVRELLHTAYNRQGMDEEDDDTALKHLVDSTVTSSTDECAEGVRRLAKKWVERVAYDPTKQRRRQKGKTVRKTALVLEWLGLDEDELITKGLPSPRRQKRVSKPGHDELPTSDDVFYVPTSRALRRQMTSSTDHDSSDEDDHVIQRSSSFSFFSETEADLDMEEKEEAGQRTEVEEPDVALPHVERIFEPLTPEPESSPVVKPSRKDLKGKGKADEVVQSPVAPREVIDLTTPVSKKRRRATDHSVERPRKKASPPSQNDMPSTPSPHSRRRTLPNDFPRSGGPSSSSPQGILRKDTLPSKSLFEGRTPTTTSPLKLNVTMNLPRKSFFEGRHAASSPLKPNATAPQLSPSPCRPPRRKREPTLTREQLKKEERRMMGSQGMAASLGTRTHPSFHEKNAKRMKEVERMKFQLKTRAPYEEYVAEQTKERFERTVPDEDPMVNEGMNLERRDKMERGIRSAVAEGKRLDIPSIGHYPSESDDS